MYTKGHWNAPGYTIWKGYANKPNYPIHAKKRGKIAEANRIDDARLMAAAHDLLEALQEMIRLAEHEGWEGFLKAKDAVQKATKGD